MADAEAGVGDHDIGGGGEEDSISGLIRQIVGQNPEVRAALGLCERYIPCFLLVFAKSLFDHGTGTGLSYTNS